MENPRQKRPSSYNLILEVTAISSAIFYSLVGWSLSPVHTQEEVTELCLLRGVISENCGHSFRTTTGS